MPKNNTDSGSIAAGNERGQSMLEFLVVLPVMLTLIFGTIQLALIFHAKITLNFAVFEAVRAGSLANAEFDEIREGFARGLAPLYSAVGDDGDQVAAMQRARDKVLELFADEAALVRIERLGPSDNAFLHHGRGGTIPNDNLLYRSATFSEPVEMSLQDANLLHLRVTYWYPLYVPFVNTMIHSFVCRGDEGGRWKDDPGCSDAAPRLPLTAVAALRMQSPARDTPGFYRSPGPATP